MAIFGSKKNTKAKAPAPKKEVAAKAPKAAKSESNKLFGILKNPRITEKATFVSEHNVYTFDVSTRANEPLVKRAIKETYGVTPLKVNLLTVRGKKVYARGKEGNTS